MTVEITVVTETKYTVSDLDAESILAGAKYQATGEEDEYGYHVDDPFDTLDHFHGAPSATSITFSTGESYTYKEETN